MSLMIGFHLLLDPPLEESFVQMSVARETNVSIARLTEWRDRGWQARLQP